MQVAEQQSGGLCSPFLCYLLEFPSLPWEETVSQASQVLRCEAQNRAAEYIPSSLQFIFVASATGYLTIFFAHLPLFQASPAPIIVNTDTLDTIPYVSNIFIKTFFKTYGRI